jgi:hypothetical protein
MTDAERRHQEQMEQLRKMHAERQAFLLSQYNES